MFDFQELHPFLSCCTMRLSSWYWWTTKYPSYPWKLWASTLTARVSFSVKAPSSPIWVCQRELANISLTCERHNKMLANCWRQIELVSILDNFSPTACQHVVHTPHLSFPTRFGQHWVWRVKAAKDWSHCAVYTHNNLSLPKRVGQHWVRRVKAAYDWSHSNKVKRTS